MGELLLFVELTFHKAAETFFNFPIRNAVRTSFWLENSDRSTFSEIRFQENDVHTQRKYNAEIMISKNYIYDNEFLGKKEFCIGTFPYIIGTGTVIQIHDT